MKNKEAHDKLIEANRAAKKESRRLSYSGAVPKKSPKRLTSDHYAAKFRVQDGRCAICGHEPGENEQSLSRDHCHRTNKLRGLLCRDCNFGLGLFNDSIALLEMAIRYLKKYTD